METIYIIKLLWSVLFLTFMLGMAGLIKQKAKKIQKKEKLNKTRYFILKKLINTLLAILCFTALVLIWGINVKSLWVSISGLLAMIAVAFFAVWSLVGNILAGVILFFTSPFKSGDEIEILPDDIRGKVIAINTFFTLIQDDDEAFINIPNSLFFQKYLKRKKKPK